MAVPDVVHIAREPGYRTDTIGSYRDGQFYAAIHGAHRDDDTGLPPTRRSAISSQAADSVTVTPGAAVAAITLASGPSRPTVAPAALAMVAITRSLRRLASVLQAPLPSREPTPSHVTKPSR